MSFALACEVCHVVTDDRYFLVYDSNNKVHAICEDCIDDGLMPYYWHFLDRKDFEKSSCKHV